MMKHKGFTLIELMIVVFIIMIIASMAFGFVDSQPIMIEIQRPVNAEFVPSVENYMTIN